MQVKDLTWRESVSSYDRGTLYTTDIDSGRITVLDRTTGFGYRNIETGYKDKDRWFWLASGNFDIREYPQYSIEEAIELIKVNATSAKEF